HFVAFDDVHLDRRAELHAGVVELDLERVGAVVPEEMFPLLLDLLIAGEFQIAQQLGNRVGGRRDIAFAGKVAGALDHIEEAERRGRGARGKRDQGGTGEDESAYERTPR